MAEALSVRAIWQRHKLVRVRPTAWRAVDDLPTGPDTVVLRATFHRSPLLAGRREGTDSAWRAPSTVPRQATDRLLHGCRRCYRTSATYILAIWS